MLIVHKCLLWLSYPILLKIILKSFQFIHFIFSVTSLSSKTTSFSKIQLLCTKLYLLHAMSHSLLSFISMNYSQKNKTKQKTKNKTFHHNKLKTLPVGLEPTTVRLKAARSTDWAREALYSYITSCHHIHTTLCHKLKNIKQKIKTKKKKQNKIK